MAEESYKVFMREEVEKEVEKYWEQAQSSLKTTMYRLMESEISTRAHGTLRRILSDTLRPMINSILEENKERIVQEVEAQVRKEITDSLAEVLKEEAGWIVKGQASDILNKAAQNLRLNQHR